MLSNENIKEIIMTQEHPNTDYELSRTLLVFQMRNGLKGVGCRFTLNGTIYTYKVPAAMPIEIGDTVIVYDAHGKLVPVTVHKLDAQFNLAATYEYKWLIANITANLSDHTKMLNLEVKAKNDLINARYIKEAEELAKSFDNKTLKSLEMFGKSKRVRE